MLGTGKENEGQGNRAARETESSLTVATTDSELTE